jgi:hypothetical protein
MTSHSPPCATTKQSRTTRRAQTTPRHHNSRPLSFHQHAKNTILQHHPTPLYRPFPSELQQPPAKTATLNKTPHWYAIMSDLCYNCSTCHLTAGPCLRDLVQCEICYSWGHLYIFCPRGVITRERTHSYWGKRRLSSPKQ